MRELKFVEVTEDGAHMLLRTVDPVDAEPANGAAGADAAMPTPSSPAPTRPVRPAEEFLLPIDERLRIASRGDRSGLGQLEIQLEATLRPREIQARIRSGESAESVAAAAGVTLQRVLRFAYPVLQERQQVTIEARRTRIRRGESAPRLGEQVDERLRRHGVDVEASRWDAYRRDDGIWVLTLRWPDGGDERQARWSFDLPARSLVPADDAAAELQAEEPRRRLLAPAALIDEPPTYPAAASPVQQRGSEPPTAAGPRSSESPGMPAGEPTASPAAGPDASTPPAALEIPAPSGTPGTATPDEGRPRSRRRTGRRRAARATTGEAVPAESGDSASELDPQADQPTAPIAPLHAEEATSSATVPTEHDPAYDEGRDRAPDPGPTGATTSPGGTETRAPAPQTSPEATRPATQDALLDAPPERATPRKGDLDRPGSTRSRRPSVPAWDDIMFGTRPNRD